MTSLRAKAESYPNAFYPPLDGETSLFAALTVVMISSLLAAATVDRLRKLAWVMGSLGILLGALAASSPLRSGYILTPVQAIFLVMILGVLQTLTISTKLSPLKWSAR